MMKGQNWLSRKCRTEIQETTETKVHHCSWKNLFFKKTKCLKIPKCAWRQANEKGKHFSRTGQIGLIHSGTGIHYHNQEHTRETWQLDKTSDQHTLYCLESALTHHEDIRSHYGQRKTQPEKHGKYPKQIKGTICRGLVS